MSEWLGTRDASHQLGVTLRLYRLIDEGDIPAYKMGRVIRLRAEDVEEYGRGHGDPSGQSGDREPLVPRPSAPTGSVGLDLLA